MLYLCVMKMNLFEMYESKELGKHWLWNCIADTINKDYGELSSEIITGEESIDIKLIVNGKEYTVPDKFFGNIMHVINETITEGMSDYVEKRAANLLNTIDNLSVKLKADISEISPRYNCNEID